MPRCRCRAVDPVTVYRAAVPDALRIVPLDQLTLVFHRPAGATHLLAEPAPEILSTLQEDGPADAPVLLARMATRFELDPAAHEGIAARLDELVEAGLIEVAPVATA